MGAAMTISKPRRYAKGLLWSLALIGVVAFAPAAQAGFLDSLFSGFGGFRPQPSYAYSDPHADIQERRVDPAPGYSVGAKAFCVRLCDGRYYPITSASRNSTPVQMCSAMCPAAKSAVFRGGEIDSAVDSSGTRYSKIDQAFAYRKSVVSNCTCNGKDPYGLVQIDPKSDPTLRAGDLVATEDGLKPFGSSRVAGAGRDRLSSTNE